MSTPSKLDEIQARADKATEGPWELDYVSPPNGSIFGEWIIDSAETLIASTRVWTKRAQVDAEFIAHAREDVPKLVAALRAVEAVHEPILALDYGVRDAPLKRQVCTGCGQDDGNWQIWPCPTIRAITGALG